MEASEAPARKKREPFKRYVREPGVCGKKFKHTPESDAFIIAGADGWSHRADGVNWRLLANGVNERWPQYLATLSDAAVRHRRRVLRNWEKGEKSMGHFMRVYCSGLLSEYEPTAKYWRERFGWSQEKVTQLKERVAELEARGHKDAYLAAMRAFEIEPEKEEGC